MGGKTTAVWRIAVEASREIINGKSEQIPILLSLRSWTPTHLCRDLVQDRFDLLEVSREAVEQELVKGNCLLLIDGLNEIRESLQTEAYQELISFLNKYEKNSVLICCRTSAYEPRMLEDDEIRKRLRIYEIRRMGRDQITEYVDRHFSTDTASAQDLLSKLGIDDDDLWEAQSSLIQLARIPLYLRLFIIEYERSRQLPTTEAKLIRVLIDRILEREKSRESAKWVKHKETDIAILPLGPPIDSRYDLGFIDDRDIKSYMDHYTFAGVPDNHPHPLRFGPGDEVFTLGLFEGHPGEHASRPVVRFGHIALVPPKGEKIKAQIWPPPNDLAHVDRGNRRSLARDSFRCL